MTGPLCNISFKLIGELWSLMKQYMIAASVDALK